MTSVDVIIPCYRYAHFLHECVQSVLNQKGVNVRILIIDDASPDNTADIGMELARQDPRIEFRVHSVNRGHIATYNEGLEWASSSYLLLLSADDYLLPGALSRATTIMDEVPEIGLTFGKALNLHLNGTTSCSGPSFDDCPAGGTKVLSGAAFIRLSGATNIVPTPTAIVRTSIQKIVGEYDSRLPHAGDMEMWLRFAAVSCVAFLNEYQAAYRIHSANMSLDYVQNCWLDDLQQRRLVINMLEARFSTSFTLRRLHSFLYRDLARIAIAKASTAFNKDEMITMAEIIDLALEVYPRIRHSRPWLKLSIKRKLGLRAWRIFDAMATVLKMRHPVPDI